MKTIFITYDQAHHDDVVEVLTKSTARGYTLLQGVGGRGSKNGEPHLGSHAWPSMNNAILTIVEDKPRSAYCRCAVPWCAVSGVPSPSLPDKSTRVRGRT